MDTTRRTRSLKQTIRITKPTCGDLVGDHTSTAALVLSGVQYLAPRCNR